MHIKLILKLINNIYNLKTPGKICNQRGKVIQKMRFR